MPIDIILGSQWGDEGKGKLTDILCQDVQICARAAGGHNAGHSIVANGVSYSFHLLPSGLVNPRCTNLIGSAVVFHVPSFFKELAELVGSIVHPDAELVFNTSKPDGMPRKLLDVSKLTGLGWKAKTGLADGIRSTYEWFLAQDPDRVKGRATTAV